MTKKHNHPELMSKEACAKDMKAAEKDRGLIMEKVTKIDNALFGENGRGGIVSDIKDIKAYTGVISRIVVPIVIAVASSLITAGLLGVL